MGSFSRILIGLFLVTGIFSSGGAFAQAKLEDYFKTYSHKTVAPFTMYHWYKGPDVTSASDPEGFHNVQKGGSLFWKSRNASTDESAMFGPALYLAFDPISTRSFGQFPDWTLLEVQIPQAFRILDLHNADYESTSPVLLALLKSLDCPADSFGAASSLARPSPNRSAKCESAVRAALTNLGIEGIIYAYDDAHFLECQQQEHSLRGAAMILIDPSRIKAESVFVYSSKTSDGVDGRIRIQSEFYKLASELTLSPYPVTIRSSYPPVLSDSPTATFLWSDLEGRSADPNVGAWIEKNLYGCGSHAPYGPLE